MRAPLTVVPKCGRDDGIEIEYGKERALVPDGDYPAVFLRHETKFLFETGKLFLWFRIIEAGEHFGKELYRPYRVAVLRNGHFKVKRGSDLFEMLCRVLCLRLRPDRVSFLGLNIACCEFVRAPLSATTGSAHCPSGCITRSSPTYWTRRVLKRGTAAVTR